MKQTIKKFFKSHGRECALVCICALTIVTIGMGFTRTLRRVSADREMLGVLESNLGTNKIMVHVKGAVLNEGLYELDRGSRMCDAVTAAGGFSEDAESDGINLAAIVEDGDEIIIPSKTGNTETSDGKININTANLYELMTLPDVGQVTAQKIIDYRTENGSFTSIEQLKNIKGLGGKNFENLKDLVTVE